MGDVKNHIVADEWVSFPGGELEGKRQKELCPDCRERANRAGGGPGSPLNPGSSLNPGSLNNSSTGRSRTLCFQCYRAELDRGRAPAAAERDTTAASQFQAALPFEPVNKPRLAMLKVERATAREAMRQGMGRFADRRRQAQIAARHALRGIIAGVNARRAPHAGQASPGAQPVEASEAAGQQSHRTDDTAPWSVGREHIILSAIRAAELQLPESWLPFVVSR